MSGFVRAGDVAAILDYAGREFCECEYVVRNIREEFERLEKPDVIPLGVELWSDRFEIKHRGWRSEDGEHMAESFMIVRKEQK